jgi:hypothetical protein
VEPPTSLPTRKTQALAQSSEAIQDSMLENMLRQPAVQISPDYKKLFW